MITTRGCDWDMLMEIIMPYLPLLRKTPPGCGPSKRSSCRSRILISSPAEKIPLWSESKTHFLPKMGRKNGSWWEYFTSPKLCWQHMFTLWGMDLTAKKLFSPWANLAPQCTLASCCHTKSWRTCSHQLVGHQCLHQDSRLGRRIAWAMLRRKDGETQNLRTYWRWFHGGFLLDESMRYAKYGGLSQGLCGNLDVFESICFRRFSGKCFPNWESLPSALPTSSLNPQQRRRSGHDMLSWKFKLTMHLQKSLQSSGFVSSTGLIHNARAISGLLGITNTLMSGLQAATTPENVLYCVSIWIEKWNHLESGCIALSLVCNPSSFKVPTTDQPNSSVLIDGPVPNHPNHHGRMKFLKIHPAHGQLRGHVKRSMDSFPHPVLVGTGAIIVIVWPIIIVIYSDNVSQIHHMTRTHHRSVIHHSHNEIQIRDRSMRKTHHRSSTLWTHHRQDVFQIHHSLRIRGDRWSHPHHSVRSIQHDRCMYRHSQAWCQILKDPSWYIDSSSQLRP